MISDKWDLDGTTAYEFSGDGNGALLLPNVTYEFTYKIKKDQISIDYENESVRDGTYSFSVENNTHADRRRRHRRRHLHAHTGGGRINSSKQKAPQFEVPFEIYWEEVMKMGYKIQN